MSAHDEFTDEDWTPEEKARLAALPRERAPSGALKDRTIAAVRRRAFVKRHSIASPTRTFALAAAACLIFVAGALVGYAAARRSTRPANDARTATTRQEVARSSVLDTNTQPTRHVVWY